MALTQDQIAQNLVAQLRVLDPSVSAEVGTPERKILDTIAQAISESQVDINLLSGALDLDSKFGSDLDAFVGLFGFGRQTSAAATGFVTFGRPTGSSYDITIPTGTQVQGNTTLNGVAFAIVFQTTIAVTLAAGSTSIIAPIQSLIEGAQANLAAGTITQFANIGAPPPGITRVNNDVPTSGGSDRESDPELKVRFRNTVFRNLAGTHDQYMALAVSTQYTTKANVIGPISRYKEYFQIPAIDDATVDPEDGTGNGTPGEWTTTPSANPYAKFIYNTIPYFVSTGDLGANALFYRQDTDFILNAPPRNVGQTYREYLDPDTGSPDIINPALTPTKPNLTFYNVYTGSDTTVTLPRPSDVVLAEYSYMSTESRNDMSRNITNCVDVYVNGQNPVSATTVLLPPDGALNLFTANSTDKFYYGGFRRIGQPNVFPTPGNVFMGLFWQPVIALPRSITVVGGSTTYTYLLGVHYWAVEDKTLIGNTVRSRNGIEWDMTSDGTHPGSSGSSPLNGIVSSDPPAGPYTGQPITSTGATSLTISNYTYDQNIVVLQAALDNNKQITTDVLAHRATKRYFKLDMTVVYAPGAGVTAANQNILTAIAIYFNGQYFGTTIQLSDLINLVRSASGVQNVRWSNDVLKPSDDDVNTLNRVTECDVNGHPLTSTITATTTDTSASMTSVAVTAGPTPVVGQIVTGTGIPGATRIVAINDATYTLSNKATASATSSLTVTAAFNTDFYLKDDELPALPGAAIGGDTLAGVIIRPRAENTFSFS